MRIAVLGTGWVGRAIGGKLADIGHAVTIGTRDPDALMARTEPDLAGRPPFSAWHAEHPTVGVETFADAARDAELIVNATQGAASLDALTAAGEANLAGKVLIDISTPLDFSHGMPPSLFVCNTDSLGEQIQAVFPGAKVVKTLNTVTADVMIDPRSVANGEHTMYVCGNDAGAKAEVTSLLKDGFGWKHVLDLGGIETARALEMALPLWLAIVMKTNDRMFNFSVVR
jgi:predicted dinucleotide-binding enzyme